MEKRFLEAIAATPEDDAPRLVFADWLDERGRPEQAELIRLQCRLDPDRYRFDDPAVDAIRHRTEDLLRPLQRAEDRWFRARTGSVVDFVADWRRGFVDTLKLPVQTFLAHGRLFRRRYPLLRKLVLFRLNGWCERLAACQWLRGVREIDLPSWYSDDDARALASSPHLGAVERVVCWPDDLEQCRILARGSAWPRLGDLHLVTRSGDPTDWIAAVNEAAGRPVGSAFVAADQPFPIAADFHDCFLVGKLPDGTQLFLSCGWPCSQAWGVAFTPDGRVLPDQFRIDFPPEVVEVPQEQGEQWRAYQNRHLQVRNDHLRQTIGFVPTMIRVWDFDFYFSPTRFLEDVTDWWGRRDPPDGAPDQPVQDRGYGLFEYDWVTGGCFVLSGGNSPWCDGSGHITAT